MDLEAIATCAFLNLAFDLIVNDLIFGRGTLFPIGSQSSQEFFPVDVSVLVAVEHVGYGTHFHTTGRELGLHNAINEVFSRDESFIVLVHFTEQIRHAGLLVVHVLHESASPVIPAEVLNLF